MVLKLVLHMRQVWNFHDSGVRGPNAAIFVVAMTRLFRVKINEMYHITKYDLHSYQKSFSSRFFCLTSFPFQYCFNLPHFSNIYKPFFHLSIHKKTRGVFRICPSGQAHGAGPLEHGKHMLETMGIRNSVLFQLFQPKATCGQNGGTFPTFFWGGWKSLLNINRHYRFWPFFPRVFTAAAIRSRKANGNIYCFWSRFPDHKLVWDFEAYNIYDTVSSGATPHGMFRYVFNLYIHILR